MRLKIIFFLLAFALFIPFSKAIDRCNQHNIANNQWYQEMEKTSWEDAIQEFNQKMDDKFKNKIKEMMDISGFQCTDSLLVFQNADTSAFREEILGDLVEMECALWAEYKSPKIEDDNTVGTISSTYKKYDKRKTEISSEIENLAVSMNIALSTLDERRFYYVIHMRNECVIKKLSSMRDELEDFIEQVVRIPAKFINCGYQK